MDDGVRTKTRYVLCLKNRGFTASLEVRKIYRVKSDAEAESHGLLRIIDESGEDYLYPEKYFVSIEVPRKATAVFARSA
jgi:hypothetical protein